MNNKYYLLFIIILIFFISFLKPFPAQAESFTLQLQPGWNLVSLPVNTTLTKDAISSKCSLGSSIYHYNSTTKNYEVVTSLTPGLGYWISLKSACTLTLTGNKVTLDSFPVLKTGTNQIGSIYQSTDFSQIKGTCNILDGPSKYNTSTGQYEKVTILEPGFGYFIKVEKDCSLGTESPIQLPATVSTIGMRVGVDYSSDGWQYSIPEAKLRRDFELFKQSKINIISLWLHWNVIQTSSGTYNDAFLARIKNICLIANEYGIEVDIDFHSGAGSSTDYKVPSWVSPKDFSTVANSQTYKTYWINMEKHVVQYLAGVPNIRSYHLFNEPWVPDTAMRANYLSLFLDTTQAVRAITNKQLSIRFGSWSFINHGWSTKTELYQALDYMAINWYPSKGTQNLDDCLSAIQSRGKVMEITEYGARICTPTSTEDCSSADEVLTEQAQATSVANQISLFKSKSIKVVNICQYGYLVGEGWNIFNVAEDKPRPAFYEVAKANGGTQACSDGTPYNQCSDATKPSWCDNSGNLIANQCGSTRHNCACPSSQSCQADGSCKSQAGCNNMGLGTPSVNPSTPAANQQFQILCPVTQTGDCVLAYANGSSNQCPWSNWSGSNGVFVCSGLPAGTYTARCVSSTGTSSNCCSDAKTSSYTITTQACSSLSCPSDKWQRVWYTHSTGACLGNTPDQTQVTFDNNWSTGQVAYSKADDIEFRSSRTINLSTAGNYTFTLGSDDGARLWIDDVLKIDKWVNRAYTTDSVSLQLTAGNHKLRLDYYETGGDARVYFNYSSTTPPPSGDLTMKFCAFNWWSGDPNVGTSLPQSTLNIYAKVDLISADFGYTASQIQQIKAVNPNVKIIGYDDIMASDLSHPDSWYVHNTAGGKLQRGSPYTWYCMDVGNQGWRDYFVNQVKQGLAKGYDGVFVDDAAADLWGGWFTSTPDPAVVARWHSSMTGMLDYVRQQISPKFLVYNAGTGLGEDLIYHADGKFDEAFGTTDYGDWKQRVDELRDWSGMGKYYLGGQYLASGDMRFTFRAYLLGFNGKNAYFSSGNLGSGGQVYYSEWETAKTIGKPTGAYYQTSNCYARDFENGKVVVNPSTSTFTVSLGGSYRNLDTGATVSSITLLPRSGAILLK